MAFNLSRQSLCSFKTSPALFTVVRHRFALSPRAFHASPSRAVLHAKADKETFANAIKDKHRVTIVDFHADWCGPCHQLAPILEKMTSEPNKSGSGLPLDLVKINTDTDDGQALGAEYKVRALPTVIAFRDGAARAQFVGALNETGIRKFLDGV